jgi:hypothetical protein
MNVSPSQTLADFIGAIGADQPTPGCGSAGALALALAAACARKSMIISARHRDGDPTLAAAADRCAAISEAALYGVALDAEHFAAFIHSHGDGKPVRDLRALLAEAVELRRLLSAHQEVIDRSLAADAAAALALTTAFEEIVRRNMVELA